MSNIYLDAKLAGLAPFADAISGSPDAQCVVVSYGEASDQARAAVESAARNLGFGEPAFVDVSHFGNPVDAFSAVEGIGPAALIILDELAASMLGQAYRTNIPLNVPSTLLGRPCAAFISFGEDLERSDTKQRDWACMKMLVK